LLPLSGDDPAPFRHQVIDIPPIEPVQGARGYVEAQSVAHLDETSWRSWATKE
jgi:hypothetical protein